MCHTIAMGAGKRFSARVAAGEDARAAVLAALTAAEEFAVVAALDAGGAARLVVVVEELVSNALRHGADSRVVCVSLTIEAGPNGLELAIEDDGAPFDPTQDRGFAGPNPETGGGVGLALVRAWADALTYARVDGRNRLGVTLPIEP